MHARSWIACFSLGCLLSFTAPLEAQSGVPTAVGQPRDTTRVAPSARAPFGRVWLGTLVGAGLGAAVGGGIGALSPEGRGEISTRAIMGVFGAGAGYLVGGILGAHIAGRTPEGAPAAGPIVSASLLSAIAGGIVWHLIGKGFEPKDPTKTDYSSWYAGAAAGMTLQITATALAAWQRVPRDSSRIQQKARPAPPAAARVLRFGRGW